MNTPFKMKQAKKLVPELRFPEFDKANSENVYKTHKFKNLFEFKTGKNIKQKEASPEFKIPCVRYGELYHLYNEVINEVINKTNLEESELLFSEGNEILLPSAGEDPLDIGSASALTLKNIAIGRTINILKPKKDSIYSQIYLSYCINEKLKRKIARLAKGVSISNVYNSDLKTLSINLPSLPEQQKIANFLSQVDKKIDLLRQKRDHLEQYKKGVMQKLFSQEVRFKKDDGSDFPDWQEKRLGEVLNYEQPTKYIVKSTEYNDKFKTPVLTAGKSFILGYTNEEANIYSETPVIIFDDFTLANHYVDFDFKVKSSAMKILSPSSDRINMKFVYESMQVIKFSKGEEHKRFWISVYSKIKINYPCKEEQTKIANYLSAIDQKISFTQQQLEQTQTFKKGLLQKMFV